MFDFILCLLGIRRDRNIQGDCPHCHAVGYYWTNPARKFGYCFACRSKDRWQ